MDTYSLNNINLLYLQKIQIWGATLVTHANYLIAILALIQIIWSIAWMTIKGNEMDSIVATTLKQVIIIGFFYTLIINGGQWVPAIINSFMQMGAGAGSISSLDPSSVFGQGLYVANEVFSAGMEMGFLTHTFGALMSIIVACVIVFSYVLIAADLIVTLVMVYIIYASSCIFFAFGASALTSPMAKNMIQKCIALGLKLMGLYLVVGIGTSLAGQWYSYLVASKSSDTYYTSWLTVAGACLIFYLLTKNIPPFISSLAGVGGLMTHGGEAVAGAIAGASVAGRAAGRGYHGSMGMTQVATGGAQATVGAAKAAPGAAQSVYGAAMSVAGAASLNPTMMSAGARQMGAGAAKVAASGAGLSISQGAKKMKAGGQRIATGTKPQPTSSESNNQSSSPKNVKKL